jgi:hypothetical protein
MARLQCSTGGDDIRNDLLHFVESLLREDIEFPFTLQESWWNNIIFLGPTLVQWRDDSGGNTNKSELK